MSTSTIRWGWRGRWSSAKTARASTTKRPAAAKGKRPGAPFDLAQLPDDVLDATLHPLGPAQLLVARLACKRWRAAADRLQASVPWMAAHLTLHTLLRQRRPAKAIVERARTCKSYEHETTADEKLGIVGTPLHLALSAPPGALPAEVALALTGGVLEVIDAEMRLQGAGGQMRDGAGRQRRRWRT